MKPLAGTALFTGRLQYLVEKAIREGATLIYVFDEVSGDLLNVYGTGNDCQNDSAVTPFAEGVNAPDKLAYDYLRATGSSPLFGHTEGTRPSAGTTSNFSVEVICRRTGSSLSAWIVVELRRSGGFSLASLQHTAGGTFQSNIFTTSSNQGTIATGSECDTFAHYLWTYNGTNHIGYRNAVQKYSNAFTGNMTDGSPFGLSIGGGYQVGSVNGDVDVDFVAIYQERSFTLEEVEEHHAASGVP